MNVRIEDSWQEQVGNHFETDSFKALAGFVRNEYLTTIVYPHPRNIFKAFSSTPFDTVRVVIVGQDPYFNPGQAMGLSFSVPKGVPVPPSLMNIYKEIKSDTGADSQCLPGGDLTPWTKQGVLLLNSVLTVRKGEAASHAKKGWEQFTDQCIEKLNSEREGIVFLLWGAYAQKKGASIDRDKHLVLETSHPSPLGAQKGFIGSEHFSLTNDYLREHKQKEIKW